MRASQCAASSLLRLCDRADSAQVILSDVVRSLVGNRGGYRFVPLGAMELKGFTDPVMAFELEWRAQREPGSGEAAAS